ncbi:dephospho-CoA kinase [Salipaludibacillus aurantiacus]|uniref:Dephospho-CoA kinase n=1 Tax=Salipaludibacillus aurantiacus TaxID=1601833 RepID=A0A1H9SZH1_9BACI|nr:dephospho-CoA kinase [Salipaludibacillus aurantiacus]SER89849.1 dephospho-CoA kinase [Salipaludibacillus aurantiacus]
MILGLTGGIATGKSTVSDIFRNEGIPVIDADIAAREAVEPGEKAYQDIINHFGLSILNEDGTINREKLGEIVFNNEKERKVLNGIVHPAVRQKMKKEAECCKKDGHSLVVMDIPLLIESDLFHMVDDVLVVYVNETIQLERLMERNSYSEEEALKRINAQLSIEKKRSYASYVIDNSGSREETQQQVKRLLKKFENN